MYHTDSKNTKKTSISQKVKRFLLFALMLSAQMAQAVYSMEEAESEISPEKSVSATATITITGGAIVFGADYIHISNTNIKKTDKKTKSLNTTLKKKEKFPKNKKSIVPVIAKNKKVLCIFTHTRESDKLLSGFAYSQPISISVQYKIKSFINKFQNTELFPAYLSDIYLISLYKNSRYSYTSFLQNFSRPPPNNI